MSSILLLQQGKLPWPNGTQQHTMCLPPYESGLNAGVRNNPHVSEEQSVSPISRQSLSPIRDKWEEPDRTLKTNIAWKSVCSLPTCFSADTLAPNSSHGLFPHFLSNYVVWVLSLPSLPPPPGINTTSRSVLIKAQRGHTPVRGVSDEQPVP